MLRRHRALLALRVVDYCWAKTPTKFVKVLVVQVLKWTLAFDGTENLHRNPKQNREEDSAALPADPGIQRPGLVAEVSGPIGLQGSF